MQIDTTKPTIAGSNHPRIDHMDTASARCESPRRVTVDESTLENVPELELSVLVPPQKHTEAREEQAYRHLNGPDAHTPGRYDTDDEMDDSAIDDLRAEAIKMDNRPHVLFRLRRPWRLSNYGLFAHFLLRGFVASCCLGVLYSLLQGVLAIKGNVYSTAQTTIVLPLALKFIFGFLSDSFPIYGYRRRSYAIIGWTIAAANLLLLALLFHEPVGFYCFDGTSYDQTRICNPQAQENAHFFILMLTAVYFGLVIADAAADGLVVEICQAQTGPSPADLQMFSLILDALGSIVAYFFLGLCFNGHRHLGIFDWELSLRTIMYLLSALCMTAALGWLWLVSSEVAVELRPGEQAIHARAASTKCMFLLDVLCSHGFSLFVIYNLLATTLTAMSPPCESQVWAYVVRVENMQAQGADLVNSILTAVALELVRRFFLDSGWRQLVVWSTCISVLLSIPVVTVTVYDLQRSQYIFLFQEIFEKVPISVVFLVCKIASTHLAPRGQEATVSGLVSSTQALSYPLGRGIANSFYGIVPVLVTDRWDSQGALAQPANYISDTHEFRNILFAGYVCMYLLFVSSSALVYMLPAGRYAAYRVQNTPLHKHRMWIGLSTAALIVVSFVASGVLSLGAVLPQLSCKAFFGGDGKC